jgi:hypothetical protein
MESAIYKLGRFLELVCITGVCLVLFAMMMPWLDQGRTEARTAFAWIQVRQIRRAIGNPAETEPLPEKDPWDQPYRTLNLPDGSIRVLSTSNNQTTSPDRPDADDIYSDMPMSPLVPFERRRTFEWCRALAVAGGLWSVCLWQWKRKGRDADGTTATDSE